MKREGFAWIGFLISLLVILFLLKHKSEPGKKIEKVKTVTKPIHEPLELNYPLLPPRIVYVDKIVTEKGRDSIIYRDTTTGTTIQANLYKRTLSSNKAKADLNITTTGDLLDISGYIDYPETTITKEITTVKHGSSLFLSLQSDTKLQTYGAGLDLNLGSRFLLGVGGLKVQGIKDPYITVKLGYAIIR